MTPGFGSLFSTLDRYFIYTKPCRRFKPYGYCWEDWSCSFHSYNNCHGQDTPKVRCRIPMNPTNPTMYGHDITLSRDRASKIFRPVLGYLSSRTIVCCDLNKHSLWQSACSALFCGETSVHKLYMRPSAFTVGQRIVNTCSSLKSRSKVPLTHCRPDNDGLLDKAQARNYHLDPGRFRLDDVLRMVFLAKNLYRYTDSGPSFANSDVPR
jgi:hypothetical protein